MKKKGCIVNILIIAIVLNKITDINYNIMKIDNKKGIVKNI